MFTGIIETTGTVTRINTSGTNKIFTIQSVISNELKIDQSLAHDGVCLTVIALGEGTLTVEAIEETLNKTTLGDWEVGTIVNLERCMPANGRFDGHIVQGHVDGTGICTMREDKDGSWIFAFSYPQNPNHLTVDKGSICINGVSLTVVNSTFNSFSVAIIPYTFQHTNFGQFQVGQKVNLEFDIIGKYISRLMELKG